VDVKAHRVYISVGSNLGNKLDNCQKGIAALTRSVSTKLKAISRFYKTEPVDYLDQDWFINAVIKIETTLDPFQVLDRLKTIEKNAGRTQKAIRFGPRILDLDIIFFDDRVMNADRLVIPHPRMHVRRFVLKPICDIDPTIVHPILKKDMQYLLGQLDDKTQRIVEH
jgi:2-amino-4-hydroxy-6-hydroxymethyldihydropteridine diphosphokinase